jgi:hypothetical protein
MHLVTHRTCDANTPYRTLRFQPSGDIYSIAMQVGAVWDRIASVDADAEADAPVRRLVSVIYRDLLLHPDRAAQRTVDTVEHNQQRVAAGLHHRTTVFTNHRINQRAPQRSQAAKRPGVVQANKSAVANHVSVDDSNQLPPIWWSFDRA